jgi:hypothetical protein
VDAFWRWWPELSKELEEIRVTGGEPTMTPDIYKLFDWFKENAGTPQAQKMRLAINSNLGSKKELIDKLIEGTQHINRFHLYTSCEAYGPQAEYIRDGLNWNEWIHNFERICSEARLEGLHMMMTINALCLDSIVEFFNWMLTMKRKYGHNRPSFTCNILRFPSFQSPLTLSDELRKTYHDQIFNWLKEVRERDERDANGLQLVQPWEQDQVSRLIEYLDVVKTPHRNTADRELLEHDFKVFYEQYDARRGKDFRKTFPNLVEFYDNINVIPLTKPEHDIQQPKDASIYAHRTVSEDGEVVVQDIRHRKTGESTEWYDNPLDPEARAEVLKKIGGSSIGWDTEVDGLGGTSDENR